MSYNRTKKIKSQELRICEITKNYIFIKKLLKYDIQFTKYYKNRPPMTNYLL